MLEIENFVNVFSVLIIFSCNILLEMCLVRNKRDVNVQVYTHMYKSLIHACRKLHKGGE
jgi:hypothetical protein